MKPLEHLLDSVFRLSAKIGKRFLVNPCKYKISLKDKTTEETAGADVTSFRFNLSDGTSYDLIYACYGVKNGELKSEAGGFKYFTSADIGSYWNNLNMELEAIPINESELP